MGILGLSWRNTKVQSRNLQTLLGYEKRQRSTLLRRETLQKGGFPGGNDRRLLKEIDWLQIPVFTAVVIDLQYAIVLEEYFILHSLLDLADI